MQKPLVRRDPAASRGEVGSRLVKPSPLMPKGEMKGFRFLGYASLLTSV